MFEVWKRKFRSFIYFILNRNGGLPPVRPDKTVADPPLAESSEGLTVSKSSFVPPMAGLRRDKKFYKIFWWARRDSNSHGKTHMVLSHARMPIPPLAHATLFVTRSTSFFNEKTPVCGRPQRDYIRSLNSAEAYFGLQHPFLHNNFAGLPLDLELQ